MKKDNYEKRQDFNEELSSTELSKGNANHRNH